jgi:carboxyl-terminal processing protease
MRRFKKTKIILVLIAILSITVSFKSDFFEVAKQLEIYNAIFKELNMHYIDEVNPAQLTSDAVNDMLKNLDPYTRYFDEQGVEDYKIISRGEYGGIGANSSFKDKHLIIREVYDSSPAAKAGLKAGDEIIKIDDLQVKDYEGKSINSLLRGLPNTSISVKIKRDNDTFDAEITREKIEIDPVPFSEMIDDEIGYMAFIKFNRKASRRVKEVYNDLKEDGMKKLIIDVRGNPGGLLNEVIKIVNYFVPKDQIVVTTKSKIKKWSSSYPTLKDPIDLDIPIVILINDRSASASEILAGSLQDLDRAVIVGERSYGKGLVQRTMKMPYGTQMKLTISKYYTPSGRCIQELDYTNRDRKTGLVPKFDPKKRSLFRTKNGRKVYDGGGVEPDIKIDEAEKSTATKALFKSDAIFKFAVKYLKDHKSIASSENFVLNEGEYQSFINFINTEKTSFKTKTEKSFEKAFKKAEDESYDKDIQASYNQLLQQISIQKVNDLTVNKNEILVKITDEVLKQIYYKEGVYLNKFTYDPTIKKAAELLHNSKKYHKILK